MNPNALSFYTGAIQGVEQGRQQQYQRALDAAATMRQMQQFAQDQQTQRYKSDQGLYGKQYQSDQRLQGVQDTSDAHVQGIGLQQSGADARSPFGVADAQGNTPIIRDPTTNQYIPNPAFTATPNAYTQARTGNFNAQAGLRNTQSQNLTPLDASIENRNNGVGAMDTAHGGLFKLQTQDLPGNDYAKNFMLKAQGGFLNQRKSDLPANDAANNFYKYATGAANTDKGTAATTNAATGQARQIDYDKLATAEAGAYNAKGGVDTARTEQLRAKDPVFDQNYTVMKTGLQQLDSLYARRDALSTAGQDTTAVDQQINAMNDPNGWLSNAKANVQYRIKQSGNGAATQPPGNQGGSGLPSGFKLDPKTNKVYDQNGVFQGIIK